MAEVNVFAYHDSLLRIPLMRGYALFLNFSGRFCSLELISFTAKPYFSSVFSSSTAPKTVLFLLGSNGTVLAHSLEETFGVAQNGPQRSGFMAGMVPIRIVSFLLLVTCTSLCQRAGAKASLPDAPSVQIPARDCPIPVHAGTAAGFEAFHFNAMRDLTYATAEQPRATEATNFFAKYLSPSSSLAYKGLQRSSTSDSLIGRASYAASSLVLTHDDEGNSRLNSSYLLKVLTSAVAHSAYRPYWKRHLSQPFSEFGATIGNDAGMNVFHEFEPGIVQLVKTHEPRFVSNIEEHFHHK
jgi:hypothetical protein